MMATVVAGAVNLALDLAMVIIPLWAIWSLRMPLGRKLEVTAVFSVGFS
jgi:hypothetical protein